MQVLRFLDGRDYRQKNIYMFIIVGDWYREQEPITKYDLSCRSRIIDKIVYVNQINYYDIFNNFFF